MVGIVDRLRADVEPQGTAGTAQNRVIGKSRRAGTVTTVSLIPNAAVAANGTNYRIFTVVNKGPKGGAGTGTAVVATLDTSVTSLVANKEQAFTVTSTAADKLLAVDDVLAIQETVAASGVAHGGYAVEVTVDPTA